MIKKLLSFTLAALTAASVSSSLASFGTANVRSLLKEDSLVVYDEDLGYLKGILPRPRQWLSSQTLSPTSL